MTKRECDKVQLAGNPGKFQVKGLKKGRKEGEQRAKQCQCQITGELLMMLEQPEISQRAREDLRTGREPESRR